MQTSTTQMKPDYAALEARLHRLASEKSKFELVVRMMSRLNGTSGLENVVDRAVRSIMEVIGATNTWLYYRRDGLFVASDAFGLNRRMTAVDDAMVRAAFAGGRATLLEGSFDDTLMTHPTEENRSFTWVYPLVLKAAVIGVVKVENTACSMRETGDALAVFFDYLAHVVTQEIQNVSRLKAAHDQLERLNAELEDRVHQRTAELERTNEALRASQEKFAKAFRSAPLLMTISSVEDGRYLDVNDAFCKVTGYAREAALGRTSVELGFITAADRGRLADLLRTAGRIRELELELTRADGTTLVCQYSGEIISVEGRPRLLSIASDITRRRQTEEALVRQQRTITLYNRIANVFLTSPADAMFADVLEVILETMQSRFGYFGFIDEEGSLCCPSMTPDVWERCRVADKAVVFPQSAWGGLWGRSLGRQQTLWANEGLALPEGHVRLDNALVVPISHNGVLIGQFAVANKRDGYTEHDARLLENTAIQTAPILQAILEKKKQRQMRKELEARIKQAQKMESIGNLAGGIAHDFNNILFPITGMAELLLEDLPAGSPEHENAEEILKAGRRGSDLVKQILAFSRQSEHRMLPVRVQQVLKEVVKLSRSLIPADIHITRYIQNDCGLVLADPTQLHQIAMNLITNAYHAVEQGGGEITIRLNAVDVGPGQAETTTLAPGHYARLTVADTGCGINAAVMDRIFDPYFTTKEQGKGTGLGLAVVYGIVKEHRGDIQVSSLPGQGTTVHVYLPLMDRIAAAPAASVTTALPRGCERILLVDDETPVVRLERRMLERLGYRVAERTSSRDALHTVRTEPQAFDLVITDMTMPHITGAQLARRLLTIRPDLPIILCTGFSERINAEKARELGIKGFLMKPIVKADMVRLVRRVLDEAGPVNAP